MHADGAVMNYPLGGWESQAWGREETPVLRARTRPASGSRRPPKGALRLRLDALPRAPRNRITVYDARQG